VKDLVTAIAIDALCGSVNDGDRYELEAGLNAAAKFIAAEALRQASKEPLLQTLSVVDAQESWRLMLLRMADELEGRK